MSYSYPNNNGNGIDSNNSPRPRPSLASLRSAYDSYNNRTEHLLDDLYEWAREIRRLVAYGEDEQRAAQRAAGHALLEDAGRRLWELNVQLGAVVRALEGSGVRGVLRRRGARR